MKGLKFQTKLIVYNMVIIVAIIVLVMGAFYYFFVNNLSKQAREEFAALSSKTAVQYNTLVYNMDKTALQIAANPNIVGWFTSIPKNKSGNYFIEEPVTATNVVRLLNSYNFKKDGNTRICLYNNYSDFVYTATTMTTATAVDNFFGSDEFNATQAYFKGDTVYSMFHAPTYDILNDSQLPSPNYFSIVREIKDYSSDSQKCGYVEVQQSLTRMDELFGGLGEKCYAVVLDRSGVPIYYSPSLREGESKPMETLLEEMTGDAIPFGVSRRNGDLVGRYIIEEAPLSVVFLKESSVLLGPVRQFSLVLLLSLGAALLVAVISENLLVSHLSRPLVALNASIKNVNIDNLRLELEYTTDSDELKQLGKAFNKMLAHLSHAIDKQLVSRTNELKSNLFALQSQMNPHFLYNILAIISMEAEINGNQKIVKICSSLSKMLSFSASMGNGFCTLKSEMGNAKSYMELMKERYEDLFEYHITVDEKLGALSVPKLIVQPICENCFKHAFQQREPVWEIWLTATADEGNWYVTIEDNGTGFPNDYLESFAEMTESLTIDSMKDEMEKISVGGLCIPNIFMRLKLCYGEEFICRIENTQTGSRVTLGGAVNDTSDDSGR